MSKRKASVREQENLYKPLDIQRTLAERLAREKREKELFSVKDDLSNHLSLSDSCFDLSQDSSKIENKSFLERQMDLKIFDEDHVFHLFTKKTVNFSWLKGDTSNLNVPKMNAKNLCLYIDSEIKGLCVKHNTSSLACRYLLYLMSVESDCSVINLCSELLREAMSNSSFRFTIPVVDLLTIIMNYGTVKSKVWPVEHKLQFPSFLRGVDLETLDPETIKKKPFPEENFSSLLSLLLFNLKTYPYFSSMEKESLFYMMLNLAMANGVVQDPTSIQLIKNILWNIIMSFSEEEWSAQSFRKVEDLVSKCWHNDLDSIGILQRIGLIPADNERGLQLQKAASFYAIQVLMDCDPIILCGVVALDEVIPLVAKPPSDLKISYVVIMLLSYCVDMENEDEMYQKSIKELRRLVNEWRHSIRDCHNDMDENRLLVKDVMIQICSMWEDCVPIQTVV